MIDYMGNMKRLTVQKRMLINRQKIPQMPQNLSAQIVSPSSKVWNFDEKKASLGVRSPWCNHLGIFMATSKRIRPHCAIFCE